MVVGSDNESIEPEKLSSMSQNKPSENQSTAALAQWVTTALIDQNEVAEINSPVKLKALTGDASSRRYFHIADFPQYLAVFSPPDSSSTG